jgi:hypothetical protein
MLNDLESTEITDIHFDLLKNKISIETNSLQENGDVYSYIIVFEKVSAFLFVEGPGESRFKIEKHEIGEYLELSSIGFYKNGIGQTQFKSKYEKWIENYKTSMNFGLEIWNSMLLIEAGVININDKKFVVRV